jgi:hypothetical protein
VNDVVARGAGSLVNDRRQRWVAAQRVAGVCEEFPDFVVDVKRGPRSFILIGDTGEADGSQYAVVGPLRETAKGTQFVLIASDVVYPAGSVNDYPNAFYVPYHDVSQPVYAIPGNHDWYDGLEGFMFNFCGAEALPPTEVDPASYSIRQRLWRAVWRQAAAPDRETLFHYRSRRLPWSENRSARHQPGPYFALDLGKLLVVCVDTGVTGELDVEQGDWLRRISQRDQPKLLVTGKPIYVDNEHKPGRIDDYVPPTKAPFAERPKHRFVDQVIRDPDHRYIAAIGGDIHNYQRYVARKGRNAPFTYLVSGGGGAYLGSTHTIELQDPGQPRVKLAERTYPSPAQSLQAYGKLLVPEVWRNVLRLLAACLGAIVGSGLVLLHSSGCVSYWWVERLAVASAAFAVLMFLAAGRARADWRRRALLAMALAVGTLVPLLARIVTDGHQWTSFAGLEATAGTIGMVLVPVALATWAGLFAREVGDNYPRVYAACFWALAAFSVVAFADWMLRREAAGEYRSQILFALVPPAVIALGVYVDRRLGKGRQPSERSRARGARRFRGVAAACCFAVLVAVSVALWLWNERTAMAELVTIAAVAHVLAFLVFAYYLRRVSAIAGWWVLASYVAFAAGIVSLLLWVDAVWALRFLGGLVCITALVLGLAVAAYLYWVRGFAILRHFGARHGVIGTTDAEDFLAWNKAGRPPDYDFTKDVHIIGTIVHPSRLTDVRSPVHHALSEIFEPREPPLYKSFLRIDVLDAKVVIKCYGVQGFEETSELVETVELELPA